MSHDDEQLERMRRMARDVAANAHAPYSRFHVGAALRTRTGRIFTGCNVENATFGATCCAERVAIGSAVAAGERHFDRIVIHTATPSPVAPCGICRQVLLEFGSDIEIISFCDGHDVLRTTSADLLPHAFSGEDFAEPAPAPGATEPTSGAGGEFDDRPRTELIGAATRRKDG